MLKTLSGKIVRKDYIEDEMKEWRIFLQEQVVSGVAEIGDEVEFTINRRTDEIKKIWLLKELGKEDASPSHTSNSQTDVTNNNYPHYLRFTQHASYTPLQTQQPSNKPMQGVVSDAVQRINNVSKQPVQITDAQRPTQPTHLTNQKTINTQTSAGQHGIIQQTVNNLPQIRHMPVQTINAQKPIQYTHPTNQQNTDAQKSTVQHRIVQQTGMTTAQSNQNSSSTIISPRPIPSPRKQPIVPVSSWMDKIAVRPKPAPRSVRMNTNINPSSENSTLLIGNKEPANEYMKGKEDVVEDLPIREVHNQQHDYEKERKSEVSIDHIVNRLKQKMLSGVTTGKEINQHNFTQTNLHHVQQEPQPNQQQRLQNQPQQLQQQQRHQSQYQQQPKQPPLQNKQHLQQLVNNPQQVQQQKQQQHPKPQLLPKPSQNQPQWLQNQFQKSQHQQQPKTLQLQNQPQVQYELQQKSQQSAEQNHDQVAKELIELKESHKPIPIPQHHQQLEQRQEQEELHPQQENNGKLEEKTFEKEGTPKEQRNKKNKTKYKNNEGNDDVNKENQKNEEDKIEEIIIDDDVPIKNLNAIDKLRSQERIAQIKNKQLMANVGKIVKVIDKNDGKLPFGFIKIYEEENAEKVPSNQKDDEQNIEDARSNEIFFSFNDVQSNLLPLLRGDEVEFKILNPKKPNQKRKASNVVVRKLTKRNNDALRHYIINIIYKNIHEEQDSDDSMEREQEKKKFDVIRLLTSSYLWKEIADQISMFSNDHYLILYFLKVLNEIHKIIRTLDEKYRQALLKITTSKFFSHNGPMKEFVEEISDDSESEEIKVVKDFLLMVMKLIPEKRPIVITLIKPFMKNPSKDLASFLYQMLKLVSSGVAESVNDLEWRELPLILKKDEIFDPDISNLINIKPVQVDNAYTSPDDYVDVYFRLLREDCFNSLRKRINELMNGKLDHRDMNVYEKVCLMGISFKDNSLYIALRIKPVKEVKNWDTSSNLMFGNLLCISIGGDFQNPIWVTVTSRDMLKKDSIVIVQTCGEWNDMDDAEVLLNLTTAKGSVWMAESPTYYRAFQPILQSLQSLDCENISFIDELVYLKPGPLPTFLSPNTDFDTSIVFKNPTNIPIYNGSPLVFGGSNNARRITIQQFLNIEHSSNSIFDESQEKAVKTALQHRLGIIQGPPGCGKSFIGVQMLRLLLSLSNLQEPKVLVLTYKNHALDEFLKDIMKYVKPDKVIRIGGRCKDEELEKISLNSQKRTKRKQDIFVEINRLRDESSDLKDQIVKEFETLSKLRALNYDNILTDLTVEQKHSLLYEFSWHRTPVKINVGKMTDENGYTIPAKTKVRVTKRLINLLIENGFNDKIDRLLKVALKTWLPDQKTFDEYENELVGKKTRGIKMNNKDNDKKGGGNIETYDVMDEQDIEDVQNERMAAVSKDVKSDFYKTLHLVDCMEEDNEESIKSFSSNALEKISSTNAGMLTAVSDLWDMNEEDRICLVQFIIAKYTAESRRSFQEFLMNYEEKCKQIQELENQHVAEIIRGKKVIGCTITGAAIHQQILKEVQPEIVIVEEAAEVLEPQLLAAIGTWTKYMLLVGDHKQLRPPVDCYELRRNFNFDISMMERLIINNMPFSTLEMQNRQRPEFAELLLDIYPDLKTNHQRIANNDKAKCLYHSSFFWHHTSLEKSDRSVTNEDEAIRCVKLALFLVEQGYEPQTITILATYQGQTSLIRKKLKEFEKKHPILFEQTLAQQAKKAPPDRKNEGVKNVIKVHTVDMYQGDENDFVIVSLVRSNVQKKIGFLKEMNRRCVAQSRAKCGVYFIGNEDMFVDNSSWKFLIKKLKESKRIGDHLIIICDKHPTVPIFIKDAENLKLNTSYCRQPCKEPMSCNMHMCQRLCKPPHSHNPCKVKIQFTHSICGHKNERECHQDENNVRCSEKVKFLFTNCHHPGERLCYQDEKSISCTYMVGVCLPCGHHTTKQCSQNADGVECKEKCAKNCPNGHPCLNHRCFEHVLKKICDTCERIQKEKEEFQRKKEEALRKAAMEQIEHEIEQLRKDAEKQNGEVKREELLPQGDTASKYLDVEDQVKKYVQPGHNWYPRVTKIEKVTNHALRIKWLQAKKNLFKPDELPVLKFHGTSVEGVEGITKNGFRLPTRPGMYGCGVYLASDSSKSAQELYTKGSNMLLLCEVLLGKQKTVNKAMNHMTNHKLRKEGYDSLFAKRDTKGTGGVLYDEFVVYNPDQVFPTYIIHYRCGEFNPNQVISTVNFQGNFATGKKVIQSSRETDLNNPLEPHFAIVEARFLRMMQLKGQTKFKITHIEFYKSPNLEMKFNNKQQEFQQRYGINRESKMVLGFHGTKSDQIVDNIMNNNFIPSRRGKFGAGVYFSELPDYTFGYGGQQHLIMALLLPGKTSTRGSWPGSGGCEPGFDSHGMMPVGDSFSEIVIFNTDQILPCYVIYFK